MIDDIKATTTTVEFKGNTFEIEPIRFGDQLEIEEEASTEEEQSRMLMKRVLVESDIMNEEDEIDDVSVGFIARVSEAIEKANGLEDFMDDRPHPTETKGR